MTSRGIALLLLVTWQAVPASSRAQDAAPMTALADYAVLTPAVEGRFLVVSGVDLTAFVPPYFGVGHLGDRKQARTLRALVERDGYDPATSLAVRMVQLLIRAGFSAVLEPVARRPAGSIQTLAWGDLPEVPRGSVMIDLTINWLCLCSDVAFSKFYPALALRWRLLGPCQEILEPSHHLVYYHYPAYYRGKKPDAADPPEDPATLPPVAEVAEACGFRSASSAAENAPALWRCFDDAIQAAADRLVFDLGKTVK